jgi:hypothetical protein
MLSGILPPYVVLSLLTRRSWLLVIQACVAMAQPPLNNLPLYGIEPPDEPDGLMMEKIDDSEYLNSFVHFDIDPQNSECLVMVIPSPRQATNQPSSLEQSLLAKTSLTQTTPWSRACS